MASTTSYAVLAYEQQPRYQGAPAVSPYAVSTAVRYIPIQNLALSPAPAYVDRSDELRGIEGSVAQLIDRYAPGGTLTVRAYVNDLIFLLGLAGFQATVTAGAATLDKWTLAFTGTPTGGSYTITITGGFTGSPVTTGPIPWNATAAQVQIATFLSTGGAVTIDPDGAGPLFETPISGPLPETLNFLP